MMSSFSSFGLQKVIPTNNEMLHYSIWRVADGDTRTLAFLKNVFKEDCSNVNEMNFILFSTSGVHGHYGTIEEALDHYRNPEKYSEEYDDGNVIPNVTFVVVQPRRVTVVYGNCIIDSEETAGYLMRLREASWKVVPQIGKQERRRQ